MLSRSPLRALARWLPLSLALASCGTPPPPNDAGDAEPPADTANAQTWCEVGARAPANVRVPEGFCVREFATVPHPRTLAFAPNGDLFVGSLGRIYVTNTGPGVGGVIVLADDNRDGRGERHDFLTGEPDVHGVAVGGGYLWYTTMGSVFRTPLADGQRAETPGMREDLRMPASYRGERNTHPLARSVGGELYTARAISPRCGEAAGEIYRVGVNPAAGSTTETLAQGFRNPMYLRCHFRDEVCAATELGDDGSPGAAVEKLLFLRMPGAMSADYGYPTCHTTGVGYMACGGGCDPVVREDVTFPLNDTPFGFDWERGTWPEPYRNALFVGLHGSFYTPYRGAGVVWLPADPTTHRPAAGARAQMFVQGFGDRGVSNERPADVAFAPDGRMFFSVDQGNKIYWVAPTTLRLPGR